MNQCHVVAYDADSFENMIEFQSFLRRFPEAPKPGRSASSFRIWSTVKSPNYPIDPPFENYEAVFFLDDAALQVCQKSQVSLPIIGTIDEKLVEEFPLFIGIYNL